MKGFQTRAWWSRWICREEEGGVTVWDSKPSEVTKLQRLDGSLWLLGGEWGWEAG